MPGSVVVIRDGEVTNYEIEDDDKLRAVIIVLEDELPPPVFDTVRVTGVFINLRDRPGAPLGEWMGRTLQGDILELYEIKNVPGPYRRWGRIYRILRGDVEVTPPHPGELWVYLSATEPLSVSPD